MTRLSMSTTLQVWRKETCGQDESGCSKSAAMLLTFMPAAFSDIFRRFLAGTALLPVTPAGMAS